MHELVAAHAGHEIACPRGIEQQPCDMLQHGIAGTVPEGVVDLLEAIEIDVQDRKASLTPGFAPRQDAGEDLIEIATVWKPGQRVMERLGLDPRPCRLKLDIARFCQRTSLSQAPRPARLLR